MLFFLVILCIFFPYVQPNDFFCARLRGQCIPSKECSLRGKALRITCSSGENSCCMIRPKLVTRGPTTKSPVTEGPATDLHVTDLPVTDIPITAPTEEPFLAEALSVQNCGRSKYDDNSDDNTVDKRIIGGHEARKGKWPWVVSLQDDGVHMCGGSIINRQWILTAAHCFKRTRDASKWTVTAGLHDASEDEANVVVRRVVKIFFNGYDELAKVNDIALLLLDAPFPDETENEDINEICLPEADDHYKAGTTCHLMGWGYLSNAGPASNSLQETTVSLQNLSLCISKYNKTVDGIRTYQPYLIDDSQLCAGNLEGGKDSCQGDSGGPLTCSRPDGSFFVSGVTSYSLGCGYVNTPAVYAKTFTFLPWIKQVIKRNSKQAVPVKRRKAEHNLRMQLERKQQLDVEGLIALKKKDWLRNNN